jgi:hypothetical protein
MLRSTLNEVNLLNAKLLYTNKLFKNTSLNNAQKLKIVESFDRTKDIREVKLVYATLMESMKTVSAKKQLTATAATAKKIIKPLTEGLASKTVASTKPKQEILTEANVFAERMKFLAGIKK